jgi:hypothetical protein
VGAQVAPAPRQDESRLARSVIAFHEGDSHSGPLEAVRWSAGVRVNAAKRRATSLRNASPNA